MKRLTNLSGMFLIMLCFSTCKKGPSSFGGYTGTISIMSCGTAFIDVDGKTGTASGVVWKDYAGDEHNNAITATNYCYLAGLNLAPGDRISFRVSARDVTTAPPCAVTQCYFAGPANSVFVYDVKKIQ